MRAETSKVGKRGTIVIPARFRKRLGIEDGNLVIIEEREGGVLLRKAVALPVEIYTPARKAELLLSNAVDKKDYERAVRKVKRTGLDPEKIPHRKPAKR